MNKETLRMQVLAGIITESQYKVKLNENNKFPEGFNPTQTDEDDDETYEGEVLVAYEAPMEGWDTEHMDTIVIVKREDGFYVDGYISFGEFETQGPFDSLEKAEEVAYDVMEELVDGFKDNDEY